MLTTYLIQAQYMKIVDLRGSSSLPVASLSVLAIVAALILIPIMDKLVYPCIRHTGFNFTLLRRIGTGMVFAASSLAVAGWVESKRRERFENGHTVYQTLFDKNITASDMSVFYQVPQFLLIATGDVLTLITGLEFAYSQAPKNLQGLVMGVFLVTCGIGNYLSGGMANIISYAQPKWYPADNPNKGHFEYYFFLLAGLMVVNFFIFLIVARKYQYVDHNKRGASQRNRNQSQDRAVNSPG
ncbi:Solute carrier family 15 member 4 [Exaiptasia diaphana]|nr:Solute carrier family 15 member 4 [Exaiptasia diaphana]